MLSGDSITINKYFKQDKAVSLIVTHGNENFKLLFHP